MFKAVDVSEVNDVVALGQFLDANGGSLALDDPATMIQLVGLMAAIFQDAAVAPVFDDSTIAGFAVEAATALVQLANGNTDFPMFDGLLGAI